MQGLSREFDYTAARSLRQLKEVMDRQGVHFTFAQAESDLKTDLDRHHLTEIIGPTWAIRQPSRLRDDHISLIGHPKPLKVRNPS
jgi:hypothetical protein